MHETEMYVSLVISDNTALTAANVLRKMGYHNLLNLKREAYYKFTFEGDSKSFSQKIAKIDILVNANKNRVFFKSPDDKFADARPRILVREKDDNCNELLFTIKNRLGLKNIRKMERGIVWTIAIDDKPENVTPKAWEIARRLLYNKHYQTAEIINKA